MYVLGDKVEGGTGIAQIKLNWGLIRTGIFEIGFHVLHRETISNPNAKAMVKLPSPDIARLQIT